MGGQHTRHVQRLALRTVSDLVAAARAVGHDPGVASRAPGSNASAICIDTAWCSAS